MDRRFLYLVPYLELIHFLSQILEADFTFKLNHIPPPQLTEPISPLSLNIKMSDRGVVRRTRRRRSISESGHPSVNSTILDGDLVLDEHELVNKFKTLKIKISAWQCFINYDIDITIDIIKAHHVELKGEINHYITNPFLPILLRNYLMTLLD